MNVFVYVTGGGGEAQGGGVAAEGPGAGVGVTDAEERVAPALDQMIGGDTGPVVGGGVQQRPAGGVGAERGGVVRGRDGPEVHGFAVVDLDTPPCEPTIRTSASATTSARTSYGMRSSTTRPARESPCP